jgi:pyruvate/2-oxoglutarate dehydrogenase complex dihydrolipoamide acyltransferase (E2) component
MTQITRTFDSSSQAKAAVEELKQRRFDTVELVEVPGRRGAGGVVRVEAPFGTAVSATGILERHGGKTASASTTPEPAQPAAPPPPAPVQAQPPEPAAASPAPAPRSQQQQQPPQRTGTRDGLRSGPRTLSELLGIPELIDSNTYFSGFPLLIRPSRKPPATKSD